MRPWTALVTGVSLSLAVAASASAQTKVAALGASTTRGTGSTSGQSYPDQLGRLLGSGYQVRNFGRSGAKVLRKADNNYWGSSELAAALAYQPEVAILWIGGADSEAAVWDRLKGEFLGDFLALIERLRALPSRPRVLVMLSSARANQGNVRADVVNQEISPLQRQAATMAGAPIVDAPAALMAKAEYFADGIHLNNAGYAVVAAVAAAAINSVSTDGGVAADAAVKQDGAVVDAGNDAASGSGGAGGAIGSGGAGGAVSGGGSGGGGGASGGSDGPPAGTGGTSAPPRGTGGSAGGGAAPNPGGGKSGGCSFAGADRIPSAVAAPMLALAILLVGRSFRRIRKSDRPHTAD